jgi:hypothetical protein
MQTELPTSATAAAEPPVPLPTHLPDGRPATIVLAGVSKLYGD